MTTPLTDVTPSNDRELVLALLIDAPREAVYEAWTKPELLRQWFAPAPWTTPAAELDVRAGGTNRIVMRDENGNDFPSAGIYLEVVPNEKIVFTDGYAGDWQPSEKPFFTGVLTFEDAGDGRTRYIARARHWTKEAAEEHEKMGFHVGWGMCATQLETVAQKR
jgi:uncharacterized protein YndB with AHSA1/START domain